MPAPTPVLLMVRALGLGGTERQVTETARGLDRSQFAPHVACFVEDGLRKAEIEAAGVPIFRLPVTSFHKPSALTGAWQLASLIRQHRIQLVHTFDAPMNMFGILPARLAGTPVVLSSQRAHRDLAGRGGRPVLRLMDHVVDGIVANCAAMSEHLTKDEHVPANRVYVCYNGIDTSVYHPAPVQRPQVLGNGVVIGVVCALRPEKGLGTLIESFATLAWESASIKLAIVGSGPEEGALRAQVAALGIVNNVHFEPATRDVAGWLRYMDIFVLPSLSEALSNSLMEAMACGCCPVASRVGGNPELVAHDVNGKLFEAANVTDLTAQLLPLIQNEELRRRFATASAHRIATEFTQAAAAKRMGEIYEINLRRKISDKRATFGAS